MQDFKSQIDGPPLMDHPFPKSVSIAEKWKRLCEVVEPEDIVAILINADPDAMGSALALKRLFWRKVKRVEIYHINPIKRADNLALVKFLKIEQQHIRNLRPTKVTKFAIVDSQPHHNKEFERFKYDIIIDHHPLGPVSKAQFIDIKPQYGANSTIMAEYLRAAKVRPSPRLATALFYGIKTDTDNFVREALANDVNAFRYLYRFANINIIKKIESSEMTQQTLASYKEAMDRFKLYKDRAFIYMGEVKNPDILVMIADFFMRLAEVSWSIVAGIYAGNIVIIVRNAGLRGDAGKMVQRTFGRLGGSAGGHRTAARAEIPISDVQDHGVDMGRLEDFLFAILKGRRLGGK